MTKEFTNQPNLDPRAEFIEEVSTHANMLANEAQTGVLGEIADVKAALIPELPRIQDPDVRTPKLVYETMVKRPANAEPLTERAVLIRQMDAEVKAAVNSRADKVLGLAQKTNMRRPEGSAEDHSKIQAEKAIFLDEGGANKTSIVRRGVAEKAMHAVYGEKLVGHTLYQLGSGREVMPTRADGTPNPEYGVVRGLAGEFLPKAGFTEFEANLATALADGYEISFHASSQLVHTNVPKELHRAYELDPSIKQIFVLSHRDESRPQLLQVEPTGNGLEGGFDALRAIEPLEGRQMVIATNGQYRPKDEMQAITWARNRSVEMSLPVAIGDEPGDEWTYKGETFQTPARPAAAYVNELALYGQQLADFISEEVKNPDFPSVARDWLGRPFNLPGSIVRELSDGSYEMVEPNGQIWTTYANGVSYSDPSDEQGWQE